MRDITKPSFILFLVCLLVTLSLAFTYSITEGKIAERTLIDAETARKEVFSDADSFKKIDDLDAIVTAKEEYQLVKEAYQAIKGNVAAGYVFKLEPKGYGGSISMTVGVDKSGKLTGVKVGDNKETPGLGTKAAEKPFISQFVGKTPKEALTVVKRKAAKNEEIEAISGATITSTAVTKSVQAAIDVSKELAKNEGGK